MAISTCQKCGGTSFEMKEIEPLNSEFKQSFVQCASCGAVVGVMEYFNVGQLIRDLATKLGVTL